MRKRRRNRGSSNNRRRRRMIMGSMNRWLKRRKNNYGKEKEVKEGTRGRGGAVEGKDK